MDLVSDWVDGILYETSTMQAVISVVASKMLVFDTWGVGVALPSTSSRASLLIEFKRGTGRISRECGHACST
jgi:hypothetical protein